jgi:hypothetical protein
VYAENHRLPSAITLQLLYSLGKRVVSAIVSQSFLSKEVLVLNPEIRRRLDDVKVRLANLRDSL